MPLKMLSVWDSFSTTAAVFLSFSLDDRYQLRHAIYEQFTNILYAMYMEKNGSGIAEGDEVKLEEGVLPEQAKTCHIEGFYLPFTDQEQKDEEYRYIW